MSTPPVEPWPIIRMKSKRTGIRMFTMLHVKNPACPDTPHSARLTGCGCIFTRNQAEAETYANNPAPEEPQS